MRYEVAVTLTIAPFSVTVSEATVDMVSAAMEATVLEDMAAMEAMVWAAMEVTALAAMDLDMGKSKFSRLEIFTVDMDTEYSSNCYQLFSWH